MNAIEFSAVIEKGNIKLPKNLGNSYNHVSARVILLFDEKENKPSQKEALRAAFDDLNKVNAFSTVDNPTEWQKKLRDEWE